MTWTRWLCVFFCSLLAVPLPALPQQVAAPAPNPQLLLQKSLAAMVGNTPITDITLSGTARRIAGSDDESGAVTLKALTDGHSRMDLSLPSGSRTQVYSVSSDAPAGSWSGPDAVTHPAALHNLWTNHSWFFPAFALATFLSSPDYSVAYIGQETKDGEPVIHLSASFTPPKVSAKTAKFIQHLSQTEIFLDPNSLLPVAFAFSTHPDDNALLDIPVEIYFSQYRMISGAQIPLHVQKYLNNSLFLDLQLQSASINSGISLDTFNVGAGL
jgi:hypothetical protein